MSYRTGLRLRAFLLALALAPALAHAGEAATKSERSKKPAKAFLLQTGDSIVFLGDSITQAASGPQGYITLFNVFCKENGLEVKSINAGISGNKSNDMLKRLQKDVIDRNPTWVSVSCGVNDVWHGEKGVPLPDYRKNMAELVDRCQAAGIKVLLLTATPITEDLNGPFNQKAAEYNAFLRQLAKEKKAVLCDLNRAFAAVYKKKTEKGNVLTTDGVHLNPKGNRLMASEILRALGASRAQLQKAEKQWELQGKS